MAHDTKHKQTAVRKARAEKAAVRAAGTVHPTAPAKAAEPNAWYWHDGRPVQALEVDGVLWVCGYDFGTKSEWRKVAGSTGTEDLVKIKAP